MCRSASCFASASGESGTYLELNDTNTNFFTPARRAASARFELPAPSVDAKLSPALAVVIAVTPEITALAPRHAASSDAGSFRSATTIAAPAFFRAATASGLEVERTIARTSAPLPISRRAISEPSTPVAPATRIMYLPSGKGLATENEQSQGLSQTPSGRALRAAPRDRPRGHGDGLSGRRPQARTTGRGQDSRPGTLGRDRRRALYT